MSERVVLPKFRVPGRRPHWMVLALWGVAGLVAIQVAVFAVIAWKHQEPAPDPVAQPAPQLAASLPAAAPATPAIRPAPAPTATSVAARPTMTGGMPAPAAMAMDSGRHHRARPRAASQGGGGKSPSRAGVAAKSTPAGKPDALDELLKKFK
jgi:hypothetical protein